LRATNLGLTCACKWRSWSFDSALAQLLADVSNQEYGKEVFEARTRLERGLFLHTEPRNFIDRYVRVPGQELDDSFLLRWLVFRNNHWTVRIEVSVLEGSAKVLLVAVRQRT